MHCIAALLLLALAAPLPGADLHVRPGAAGDGTRQAPLGSLAAALARAQRGDRLLLAGGTDSSGPFELATGGISILGGHAPDFSARDPVRWPSILTAPTAPVLRGRPGAPHDSILVSGLVITGSAPGPATTAPLVAFAAPAWTFVDTVLAGHPGPGIDAAWEGPSNAVVGCWLVDLAGLGLDTRRGLPGAVVEVARSTFALLRRGPAGVPARGLAVGEHAEVRARADAFWLVDGVAIENAAFNEDTAVVECAFWLASEGFYRYLGEDDEPRAVASRAGLAAMDEDPDGHMLFEAGGNSLEPPALSTDPAWLDGFTAGLALPPGGAVAEGIAELRRRHGLGAEGEPRPGLPAFPLARIRGDLTYGGLVERGAPAPRTMLEGQPR